MTFLRGLDGYDTLTGGLGDDWMDGGHHGDSYVYNLGDGHDVIREYSSASSYRYGDKLVLGAGITPWNVTLARSATDSKDLVLTFDENSGSIVSDEQFGHYKYGLEEIRFEDGTVWTEATMLSVLANSDPVAADATLEVRLDGTTQSFAYGATDPDGDTLTYVLLSQTATGAILDNGDGTFTFEPGTDFDDLLPGEIRTVPFTYQVEDPFYGRDTASITLEVSLPNSPPVAPAGTFAGVSEDGVAVQIRLRRHRCRW